MDYENKYKKALEKARQLCAYPTSKPFISDLQDLFPELKESDDEKIKKGLIEAFNRYDCDLFNGLKIKNILDWLEKQGEPTEINPSEFDLRLNKLLKQFETLPKEELASSLSFYLNVVQNGTYKEEKQGEQKSTKKKLQELSDGKRHLGWLDDADKVIEGEQKPVFEIKTPEESLGIDSDTYNKIVDECVYGEQKPAWSEEDEKMWLSAIEYVCTYPAHTNSVIDWLKSLKERHTWKPSAEQMEALYKASKNEYLKAGQYDVLSELWNNLKKLKEE